jgi:hypothetical protein
MIVAWAADPSRVVEIYSPKSNTWGATHYPEWRQDRQYRFKPESPKYIILNSVNVPEPVRRPLKYDQEYWVADPASYHNTNGLWSSTCIEKQWLSLGLIHLTKEAAQAHINAMLLPSRTDK